ncbi:hypothetical protein Tco_1487960, partial [Tanacetum coccineum]
MDLNAFIRTADPRKVRIVERARAGNERPIVTVAKHRTVTLLPTLVVRPSGELSASVEREFIGDASVSGGRDEGVASVGGPDNVKPIVPITDNVETEIPGPNVQRKRGLLQDSRLMVEQGVPALPTLPFITSSVTASLLEEGGDHTDSVTGAKSADPEVDSLVRCAIPVMTEATTVTTKATTVTTIATTVVRKIVLFSYKCIALWNGALMNLAACTTLLDCRFYPIAEQSRRTNFFSRVHTYMDLMFKDLATKKADARLKCSSMVEQQPYSDGALGVCKFK